MKRDTPPEVHEWQVLPFGMTCSPCCAIYALQRHAQSLAAEHPDVQTSVLSAFYVDNCLQSLSSVPEAKAMVNKLRSTLLEGGFEVRQWASNHASVIKDIDTKSL